MCYVCKREVKTERWRDGEMPERRRGYVRIDLLASNTSQIRLFACPDLSFRILPSPSFRMYSSYPSSFLLSRAAGVHEKLRVVGTRLGLKEHWAGRGDKGDPGDKGGASLLAIKGHVHSSSTRASAGRGSGGATSIPLPEQLATEVNGSSARDSARDRERDEVVVRSSAPLFTPVDLEVHRGLDGHLYALDFARLFPPEVSTRHYDVLQRCTTVYTSA